MKWTWNCQKQLIGGTHNDVMQVASQSNASARRVLRSRMDKASAILIREFLRKDNCDHEYSVIYKSDCNSGWANEAKGYRAYIGCAIEATDVLLALQSVTKFSLTSGRTTSSKPIWARYRQHSDGFPHSYLLFCDYHRWIPSAYLLAIYTAYTIAVIHVICFDFSTSLTL